MLAVEIGQQIQRGDESFDVRLAEFPDQEVVVLVREAVSHVDALSLDVFRNDVQGDSLWIALEHDRLQLAQFAPVRPFHDGRQRVVGAAQRTQVG